MQTQPVIWTTGKSISNTSEDRVEHCWSFYTAGTKATLLWKYSNIVFMNSFMSSRITVAYLLMALKKVTRVAAAVVHRDNTKCVRLPDTASIFRTELYAILLAIDVVWHSKEKNCVGVIFSDSMSSLQSIWTQILFKSFWRTTLY